ncbi:MAG: efflux transporter outer membrane subunit [Burkholderiaceae bacterium]
MNRTQNAHPTHKAAAALVLAAAALAGCMPAHRQAPALAGITTPQAWTTPASASASTRTSEAPVNAQWWQAFGDAMLDRYIEATLARNTDLLAAGARLDAARAQVQLAGSALGPTLGASVGVQAQRALGSAGVATTRTLQPGLQASWEPDLWGRLRTQVSAAQFQLLASQADRDAVALSISVATAQAYIGLLALQAQLAQTQATAASRAEALRIAQDKARVGYTSQLQVTQADSEYEAVLQSLPQLQTAIARQYNALRLLTGELPGTLPPEEAQPELFAKLQLPSVPVALPSELLRRRPDLAQAESLLATSDASMQASRAAFLPQVSLSASLSTLYINALNYSPAAVWSIGGSVLAPLFDQGRLSAQYDSAVAQRDQAAFAYRGATLTAFGEVENALVGTNRLQEQLDHVVRRRDVLARSVNYAKDRYEAGYAPYLEQLDAQRNLYQTEIDVINIRQSQLLNQLSLYKALGGGWSSEAL